jgi:hypothetical protein
MVRAKTGSEQSQDGSALRADYRFESTFTKKFGKDYRVKFSIDTLDAGFGGNDRGLAKELLCIEGKATVPLLGLLGDLEAKIGPGLVVHRDTQSFQADDYTVFQKPYTSVSFATIFKGYYLSASYTALGLSELGEPTANEIATKVGFPKQRLPLVGDLEVSIVPRYLFKHSELPTFESNDFRGEIEFRATPSEKIEGVLLIGARNAESGDGSYVNLKLMLNDYFNTGTDFSLSMHKVGEDYRVEKLDKYEFGLVNIFDKLILDGTTDVEIELSQKLSKSSTLYVKGDMVMDKDSQYGEDYPGSSITLEEGIKIRTSPDMELSFSYKTYDVPSGTADASDPGNMMRTVSKSSSIFKTSLKYSF